jgi:NADH:ubiquinone oxidoreductase subunit E/NAD-dependent dihydropyrimidine dehydrogenase PreA subunit
LAPEFNPSKIIRNTMPAPEQQQNRQETPDVVGAVLVIGGGVAGIQAALDLAESGQKVYLLENRPSIGGNMARLDKTFPTNDCSMCILSPKLVEAGRHLNIELLTYSDVEEVVGEPGRFRVSVNQRARYVDGEKCTGCGLCVQNCPVKYEIYPDPAEEALRIDLSAQDRLRADRIMDEHVRRKGRLMAILQAVNREFGYLPPDVLRHAAARLDLPLSLLYRISTFYGAFSLTPKGRHTVNVCMGTTCYVRGADKLMTRLETLLRVRAGETTEDRRFTLNTVRCLGCCSLAPVMTVDGETFGKVRESQVKGILDGYG